MADPIWEIKYKDELVSLYLDDLSRHRMREIASALGDDYRIPQQFIFRLLQGDMEAIAGVLWIDARKRGETLDINSLDFCDSDFEKAPERVKPKRSPKAKPSQGTSESTGSSEIPDPLETST